MSLVHTFNFYESAWSLAMTIGKIPCIIFESIRIGPRWGFNPRPLPFSLSCMTYVMDKVYIDVVPFFEVPDECFQIIVRKKLTQSKSKTQKQEVCTVSSIVILLTLIGHDMVFISFTISLEIHYTTTFHLLMGIETLYDTSLTAFNFLPSSY